MQSRIVSAGRVVEEPLMGQVFFLLEFYTPLTLLQRVCLLTRMTIKLNNLLVVPLGQLAVREQHTLR
jgi:hypothetical protein